MATDTPIWFGGIWSIQSNMIKLYNLCFKKYEYLHGSWNKKEGL